MTATINRSMATNIATIEQLNGLTQLNGVPIGVIEDRSRPGGWSAGGFLGSSDRFLEVLNNDWKTVSSLGLTHIEIAEHLDKIIQSTSFGRRGYSGEENAITYDYSQVQNANLPNLIAEINKTQKTVCRRFFEAFAKRAETVWKVSGIYNKMKAFIESFAIVFQNMFNLSTTTTQLKIDLNCTATSGLQTDIFNRGSDFFANAWSQEYVFTNCETGESVLVAHGVIEYIRRYGFYEGNVHYRADPLKLVSVLTGLKTSDLQAYIRSRSS